MSLKKGDKVKVELEGSVLNVLETDGEVTGVRITDGKRPSYWSVVPLYAVTKVEEE